MRYSDAKSGRSRREFASRYLSLARLMRLMVGLPLLGLLAGCGDQTPTVTPAPAANQTSAAQTSAATPTTAAQITAAPTTAIVAATTEAVATPASIPPGSFQNPVLRQDFPDPFILEDNGTFYAYATNGSGHNIQLATSTDLLNWELQSDAMPALPTWAKLGGSLVWAPEVAKIGDKFVMYYTARDKASNKQCVGVAVSDKPDGKFKDSNTKPLVCQSEQGGTIDPNVFRDSDNKMYLYFKNDGNCCGISTNIYVQELAPDGLSLVGAGPTKLISNDQGWEGLVIEAPTMFKHDNNYYLFFSGNDYAGIPYAVGYATCKGPTGSCEQANENPILKSLLKSPPVIGPGHQTLLQLGDQTWIVYHAWEVSSGLKTSRRFVWMDKLNWKDGKPVVEGPTTTPQPAPKVKG